VPARIAISGSAGVGKSTLARQLAATLGLPFFGEGMREYLERTGEDLHRLGEDGLRRLVLQLWDERKEQEARATDGFVADRSSYDFVAFWLHYRFAREDDDTARLLAEATLPGRYQTVYLLPWGAIPLVADGVRSTDRFLQLHTQLVIEGSVRRYAARVVDITATSLADRHAAVLADLDRVR
jgi:nicotinamide riboside kinase